MRILRSCKTVLGGRSKGSLPFLKIVFHRATHDFKPRQFDAESCNVLCNFAEMTMRELQRISESGFQRAMSWSPSPENELMLRKIDACSDGVVLLDVRLGRWPVLFSNDGWSDATGTLPSIVVVLGVALLFLGASQEARHPTALAYS